jgi:hypothetical protein
MIDIVLAPYINIDLKYVFVIYIALGLTKQFCHSTYCHWNELKLHSFPGLLSAARTKQ